MLGIMRLFKFKQVPMYTLGHTLPTAEILSGKNEQAGVTMVLFLKKYIQIKIIKTK